MLGLRMRSALALLALALSAQAVPVERDLTTTTLTATATNTTTTTTTTTTTATQLTTQTDHLTVTDHTTVVDHTTTTQIVTKTAYVLANAPPWAGQAQPFATLAPDVVASSSISGTGNAPAPAPAASPSSAGGAVVVNPNTSPAQSSALSQAQDAAPTLMPTRPEGVDPNSLNNLKPTNSTPLAFTQNGTTTDGSMPYIFAEANATYQYPTVVLPHTNYVSSMKCTPSGLQVTFSSKDAYAFVKANWKTVPFLLITESLHCNAADDGLHVYWLVSKLGYDDANMVVQVTAAEIAVENALKQINLIWGQYTPSGQTGGTSWSGTAPNPGSSSTATSSGGSSGGGGGSGGSSGSGSSGGGTASGSAGGSTGSGSGGNGSGTGSGGLTGSGGGASGTSGSGSTGGSSTGGVANGGGTAGSSTSSGGSTTYGPNSTLSCLKPPSTYMGLPTAPCGDDFDTILDQRIGFLDPNSASFAADFFPGDPAIQASDFQERGVLPRHLGARGFRFRNPLRAITNVVRNAVSTVKTAVVQTVNKVVNEVKSAAQKLVDIVSDGLKAVGNPSFSKKIDIKIVPGTEVDSVFGTANSVLVYSGTKASTSGNAQASVSVYCVDCGVRGSTTLGGALGFSIVPPALTKAEVSIAGSIKAGANLGLVASGEYKEVFKKNLVTVPIPGAGIAIANIVTIGAAVTLDAVATVNVAASGQLLVGASVEFPNFNAKLDAIGSSSGVSGFEPVFTKTFKAEGEISASLGLGLPAEIAVGITVPSIKFDKRIGLRNTPELTASANLKAATDGTTTDASICYNIGISDKMEVNLIGKLVTLNKIEKPDLFADCITLAGSGKGSTTPAPDTGAGSGGAPGSGGTGSDPNSTTAGSGTGSTSTNPVGSTDPAGNSAAGTGSSTTDPSGAGSASGGSTGSTGTGSPSSGSSTSDPAVNGSASGGSSGSTGSGASGTGSSTTDPSGAGATNGGSTGSSGSSGPTGTDSPSTGSSSSSPGTSTGPPPTSDSPSSSGAGSTAPAPATENTAAGSSGSTPAPVADRRHLFSRADNTTSSTATATSNTTTTTTASTTGQNTTPATNTTSSTNSSAAASPKVVSTNLTAPDLDAINDLFNETTGPGFDDALNAALNNSTNVTDAADEYSDFNYISLLDLSGSFALANNEDGNLFLAPATSAAGYTFASYDNVVVGTGGDLVFFYYSDEISTLGVSRFRMNDYLHIPKTADLVTLIPLDADTSSDTPGIYVAADTKGNILYPVVCSISGLESKVFLVTDPVAGVEKLAQPELQYVVTGGPVSSCSLLALRTTNNFGGF